MKFASGILLVGLVAVATAIVLEVPGYATIEGAEFVSYHYNRPYSAFRSLYYGKQPTNKTRFLPPVPVDPYPEDVILNAINEGPGCPQPGGDEDCLYVNVFTPNLPGNFSDPDTSYDKLLPVVYWIYGGAFSSGQNLLYSGSKYMDQEVVLVEVQYRLGPLGFLSLDTDEVPGNAGIFDQIEGLRWTKKFIKFFGGDPDCVTIVGESAGSASVSLLLLAPQARGLFHRAIGQSGAMLTGWALDTDPVTHSTRIAELANCPLEPYADLLDCLQNLPSKDLMNAYYAFELEDRKNRGLGFGGSSPVIQKAGAERLLTEDPLVLMQTGNYATEVPIMYGANKQEGVLVLGELYNDFVVPNNLQDDVDFWTNDAVKTLINALGIEDPTGELSANLTAKYFVGAEMGNFQSMIPGLIDLCGVYFLKEASYRTVQLHSKHNPDSYWYAFNFEGRYSLFSVLFFPNPPPIPHGVNHADELIYLFAFPTYGNNATEAILSQQMIQLWTTFAKYGKPTPDGVEMLPGIPNIPPYSDDNPAYIDLDLELTVKFDYPQTYTVSNDAAQNPRHH